MGQHHDVFAVLLSPSLLLPCVLQMSPPFWMHREDGNCSAQTSQGSGLFPAPLTTTTVQTHTSHGCVTVKALEGPLRGQAPQSHLIWTILSRLVKISRLSLIRMWTSVASTPVPCTTDWGLSMLRFYLNLQVCMFPILYTATITVCTLTSWDILCVFFSFLWNSWFHSDNIVSCSCVLL